MLVAGLESGREVPTTGSGFNHWEMGTPFTCHSFYSA
jgi:hypothetical protein